MPKDWCWSRVTKTFWQLRTYSFLFLWSILNVHRKIQLMCLAVALKPANQIEDKISWLTAKGQSCHWKTKICWIICTSHTCLLLTEILLVFWSVNILRILSSWYGDLQMNCIIILLFYKFWCKYNCQWPYL